MAKSSKIENEKLVAILSYLLIGIIWYFADGKMKESSLVKFHVKQSLNMLIISVILSIVLSVIVGILSVTIILIPVALLLGGFLQIAFLVLWILGLVNAINAKEKEVPIIGKFADQYLKF